MPDVNVYWGYFDEAMIVRTCGEAGGEVCCQIESNFFQEWWEDFENGEEYAVKQVQWKVADISKRCHRSQRGKVHFFIFLNASTAYTH